MRTSKAFLIAVVATSACFSESNSISDDSGTTGSADGTTTASATSAGTAPSTTAGTTTQTSTTGVDDSSGATQGTDCTDHGDCADGIFCIEGTCQPCTAADDPHGLCMEADPMLPACDPDTGVCAACVPSHCTGSTPFCDAQQGCQPCTEHAQCPDSACHLLGEDQGGCFDEADVVEISDLTELENELTTLTVGSDGVFILQPDTYTVSGGLTFEGEIALLGTEGVVFTGGATNNFIVAADSYLYTSQLTIENGPYRAINGSGAGLWLDDTDISGYSVGVLSDSEVHLRRSRVTGGNSDGDAAVYMSAGNLVAENSALGPGAFVGLYVDAAEVDLRYVTIAGNTDSMDCTSNTSGIVRNSIVSGVGGYSITSQCMYNMTWVDNAIDDIDGGTNIGGYVAAWFVDPAAGDFHLTQTGEADIGNIADWDEGDPPLDIDGDPRPMDNSGSFPGLDEPAP